MKVGDIVTVTSQCDAYGLCGLFGIIIEIVGQRTFVWGEPPSTCARVLLSKRMSLINGSHLEVISESR